MAQHQVSPAQPDAYEQMWQRQVEGLRHEMAAHHDRLRLLETDTATLKAENATLKSELARLASPPEAPIEGRGDGSTAA